MSETNEYEQIDENSEKGLPPDGPLPLPDGVLLRMTKHAERTGDKMSKIMTFYLEFISKEHGCNEWQEEEEDLLIDWAEQCFVELRRSTVSGGQNTVPYVGCFVGVDAKKTDRRGGMVKRATRDYMTDKKEAVDSGACGEYVKNENFWGIRTGKGMIETNEPIDSEPTMGFKVEGKYICLMGRTTGRPMMSSLLGRNYYFLGNEESDFEKDIKLWRVDALGESSDMQVKVGEPCRIQVRPANPEAAEGFKDVLGTNMGFHNNIVYTTDFVAEDEVKFLHPHKYLATDTFHDLYTPLEALKDVYNAKSRTFQINGETGRSGPIVITKGTVSRLSTEGRESPYDESGRNFVLNLTNVSLQSEFGQKPQAEVACWISGACHDNSNPFVSRKGDEEIAWAEKSTILVIGRVGLSVKDGIENPKINVMGIYADPRRIRRRTEGGDTNMSQFIEGKKEE
tara:strand:- start:407 stop:1765 length:1359 start_codon:yes stop_codon:yes gene_type:complete